MIEIRSRKTNRFLYRAHADSLEGRDLRGAGLFRADLAGANLRGRISRALTCERRTCGARSESTRQPGCVDEALAHSYTEAGRTRATALSLRLPQVYQDER